jgi:copper homeostasis protein
MMDFRLEICVDSIESAVTAQVAGADRIELCSSLPEGGTTPSYGMISSVRDNLTIGLHVLIRPRAGDFLYSDAEFDIMRRDIETCGELGVDGIVTGILLKDGKIDKERVALLREIASPMTLTFHRAFDLCFNPMTALEDVIACGAERLLTSGQMNKASEGWQLIKDLVRKAGQRIIIMPGSGIDESDILWLAENTNAREFHLSGRKIIDSEMSFRNNTIPMGAAQELSEYSRKVADAQKIENIIKILKIA